MAQNPRDQSLQNGMFDNAPDGFNYNNFYSHSQGYGPNLTAEPDLPDVHSPYNAAAYQHTPAWQLPVTSTSSFAPTHQSPSSFVNPARSYYSVPPSTSSTPFQNNTSFAGHGLQQYSHTLDPSLVTSIEDHSRSYGQTMPIYSSVAPSNTIAPAALHPGAYLNGNRPTQTPPTQMSNPTQTPTVMPQMPKPPKGVKSDNFMLIPFADLLKATNSTRLHNFVAIGRQSIELPINKATIPQYVPRKSQNEIIQLSRADPTLKAKIAKRTKKIHVPKSNRPRHLGQSPASVSSESDSSDYETDSDSDSEPEPEKFPLPVARPQDAIGATRYDTAKAVFLPRNVYAEDEDIRNGLKDFWNLIKTIRDRWKKDSEAVREAAEAKKDSEIPMLKDRVKNQRDMMEAALNTAIEFGHKDLMRACGNASPLMFTCQQFLMERAKENDHDSPFAKTLFKFLSLSTSMTSETIEKTGLIKLFTRYSKRGDAEIKALVTKITESAAVESKKKKESGLATADSPKLTKATPTETKVDVVAGVKRPRPADGAAAQSAKRVASGSVAPIAKESAASKLGLLKRPGSANAEKITAASTAVKSKVIAKPSTNFFSSLQSASKKPGTSLNTNTAAKVKPVTNGAPEKKAVVAPAAPMKSGFSFAETMANLAKAREPEPVKKPEDPKLPPETAEQKAKRLRKEARRRLRVTWKPDGNLVEIREFSRDPSEMPGNNNNVRDVRDGKEKEGLMFKQHMEMMDVDVDEEDDQPMEQNFFDFKEPSPIDFSTVDQGERERNYEPYGGGQLKVESPERQAQERREAISLMAFYQLKSDIPPCPREPADPYTGEHSETKTFGEPDDPTIVRRLARFKPPAPVAQPLDVDAILRQLAPTLQPAPVVDQNLSAIQNILQQSNNSYQPSAQVPTFAPIAQPAVSEGQAPALSGLYDILAQLTGNSQAAQPPLPQQYTAPPAAATTDISALIASLQQGGMAPQTMQAFNMPPASTSSELYVDPERKRMLEQEYERERNGSTQYGSDGDRGTNKRQKTNKASQGNPEKKFLYPCRFFKEGKCKKGANCTFRHD